MSLDAEADRRRQPIATPAAETAIAVARTTRCRSVGGSRAGMAVAPTTSPIAAPTSMPTASCPSGIPRTRSDHAPTPVATGIPQPSDRTGHCFVEPSSSSTHGRGTRRRWRRGPPSHDDRNAGGSCFPACKDGRLLSPREGPRQTDSGTRATTDLAHGHQRRRPRRRGRVVGDERISGDRHATVDVKRRRAPGGRLP